MFLFFLNLTVILGLPVLLYEVRERKQLSHKGARRQYLIAAVGYLCLLAVLRSYEVGIDTATYVDQFDRIAQMDDLGAYLEVSSMERGYILLVWLLAHIFPSARVLLVLTSVFLFFSLGRFLNKYSRIPWFSVFLFFTLTLFDFYLSGLRQALAISILLFAYDDLVKGKLFPFAALVILASQFHNSAIVFLAVYPLMRIRSSRKYTAIMVGGGLAAGVLWNWLLPMLLTIFPKYSYYLGDSAFSNTGMLAVTMKCAVALCVLAACELLPDKPDAKPKSCADEVNYRLVWFIPVISCVAFGAAGFSRFYRYFEPFICIYLPNALASRKPERTRQYMTLICVAAFIVYALVIQIARTPEWQQTYPFRFFWQD